MSETNTSNFSAKEPSLGYIYQIKFALLMLLTNAKELENPRVRIENLDDVDIHDINKTNLYQTKLHIKNKASLTDSSPDFWKTIRIWCEHITAGNVELDKTLFNLVTTSEVPQNSILFNFTKDNLPPKEIDNIIIDLDQIALKSSNKTNKKAYDIYLELEVKTKKELIKNIRIIDNSIDIKEVDDKIKKELIFSTYPNRLDALFEILEGWWLKKSIQNLTDEIDAIELEELLLKVTNIADSLKSDNLPNHFPEQIEVTDEDVDTMQSKSFIKQLDIIQVNIKSKAVKRAISDFRRAFDQRSKWLRLQLLNPDEEEEYDKKLEDYWRNIFDIMCDEAEDKSASELKKLGKEFYIEQFAKTCPQIKIREKFKEDYLTRGSYQMLSDAKKIGWHPNFKNEI